jgi:hypothetical protein
MSERVRESYMISTFAGTTKWDACTVPSSWEARSVTAVRVGFVRCDYCGRTQERPNDGGCVGCGATRFKPEVHHG